MLNLEQSCLSLENTYAQTQAPHNFSAVPSSLFNECNSTDAPEEVIEVNPLDGWASLAFTGSASMSVPTGMLFASIFKLPR